MVPKTFPFTQKQGKSNKNSHWLRLVQEVHGEEAGAAMVGCFVQHEMNYQSDESIPNPAHMQRESEGWDLGTYLLNK